MSTMPSFCRHNRLLQNCTICAREMNFEVRPVVSSSAPKAAQPREERPRSERGPTAPRAPRASAPRSSAGSLRVRRLARGVEDGYRSALVPGLKSSQDAECLAEEVAFAATRLSLMERLGAGEPLTTTDPVWLEIAAPGDADARTVLAFEHVLDGPRGIGSQAGRDAALGGLAAWAARTGSYARAFTGEDAWIPERRFERLFERLGGISGLSRDTRYELLTLLGRLGVYPLRAGRLFPSGENETTWAAKRALGIGDPLLLERRATDLAEACSVPIEALDLGLHNWGSGSRLTGGLSPGSEPEPATLDRARDALGL
jgi:hypothetical protein